MGEIGAAVATEFLIGRILGAAFRTVTTKRPAAVTAEPFAVWILRAAAAATHRLTRKTSDWPFLYHLAPVRGSVLRKDDSSATRRRAAVREMLDDQASVLEAAQKTDIDSRQIDRVLHAARTWSHRLKSEAEQTAAVAALVDRVELKADGMGVSVKLPIAGTEKSRAQLSDGIAIARSFPMLLKRRGVELRLIVGDHNRSAATADLPLLKAVARAHRWFDEISTGKANSLAEIAAREGLAVRYVGRLIRLAFLAPDIVECIVEGRQPTSLTAEAVTRHIEMPLEWRSQKTALNIQ